MKKRIFGENQLRFSKVVDGLLSGLLLGLMSRNDFSAKARWFRLKETKRRPYPICGYIAKQYVTSNF